MSSSVRRPVLAVGLAACLTLVLAGCGGAFDLQHQQPRCVHGGDRAPVTITAPANTKLHFQVQDDFGGELSPGIPDVTVPASGSATVTWTVPGGLSTSTLHILLTASNDTGKVSRDIHVQVKQSGDPC